MTTVRTSMAAAAAVAALASASATGPATVAAPEATPATVPATAPEPGPSAAPTRSAGVTVLAKADGWRPALAPLADRYYGVLEVADDADAAARAWRENRPHPGDTGGGIHRAPDEVDLSGRVLAVWSSGQSSSCPVRFVALRTSAEGTLHLSPGPDVPGRVCTADYAAYRMVLAVDRELLPPVADLPSTDVALSDALAPPVLVAGYPAAGTGAGAVVTSSPPPPGTCPARPAPGPAAPGPRTAW